MINRRIATAGLLTILWSTPSGAADQQTKPPFQEVEFITMVSGKTTDQVTTSIGQPARTEQNEAIVVWYYEDIVQALSSRKLFPVTQLMFQDGKVAEVMNSFNAAPRPSE